MRCTISVCDSSPSTNQPDWKSVCAAGVVAWKTYPINPKVAKSKIELTGPKHTMKRPRPSTFQCWGVRSSSSSTLSKGMPLWEMS